MYNYYEPFATSCVNLLRFRNQSAFNTFHLNFINKDLMNMYSVIKTNPHELVNELQRLKTQNQLDHSNERFYSDLVKHYQEYTDHHAFATENAASYMFIMSHHLNRKHAAPSSILKLYAKHHKIPLLSKHLQNVFFYNTNYIHFLDKLVSVNDIAFLQPPQHIVLDETFAKHLHFLKLRNVHIVTDTNNDLLRLKL